MSLFKSKNAAAGMYVVVQHVVDAEVEEFVGKPWTKDEALRIFDGVLRSVPTGFFNPGTGNTMRVVALDDWEQPRLAAALLES